MAMTDAVFFIQPISGKAALIFVIIVGLVLPTQFIVFLRGDCMKFLQTKLRLIANCEAWKIVEHGAAYTNP